MPGTVPASSVPPQRPLRADAARNRRALIGAAREVFERDGFVHARITDIARAAGVAHGSFYSHFQSKEEALAAVLAEVQEEMLHPGPAASPTEGSDPVAVIEAANRAYLEAYRRNARLMAMLEQVATVDEDFKRLRLERSDAFVKRNAKAVRRLQRAGLADPDLDPDLTALAISTMVSRTAYVAFVLRHVPADFELLVVTLTRLWTNALAITTTKED
jgi:AcrR family transcriptional regulator